MLQIKTKGIVEKVEGLARDGGEGGEVFTGMEPSQFQIWADL